MVSKRVRRIANAMIAWLGRSGYRIDENIDLRSLCIVLAEKMIQAVRGVGLKLRVRRSAGIVFLGRHCCIRHAHKISLGRTVYIGDYVEINALSLHGVIVGNNVSIHRNTVIDCTGGIRSLGESLDIGNNVGISRGCTIQVRGKVTIGNSVLLGPGVSLFSENHNFDDISRPINEQGERRQGVTIEDGVWVGAHAIILDGVTVGAHSVIAAGSIVTKNVPPYAIVAGVPGRVLSYRGDVLGRCRGDEK